MLQFCWTYPRARGLYLILLPPKFAGFAVIRTLQQQQQQCTNWMFRAPTRVSNLSLKLPKKGENVPFPFSTLGMMHPFHNAVCLLRQSVCVIINPEDHFRFFWFVCAFACGKLNGTYVMRPLWWRIANSFFYDWGLCLSKWWSFSSQGTHFA